MKLRQVLDIHHRHRMALGQILSDEQNPQDLQGFEMRWAFLVTLAEMNELLDDIQGESHALFPGEPIAPGSEIDRALREGRAPLIVNTFAIFPDLEIARGDLDG